MGLFRFLGYGRGKKGRDGEWMRLGNEYLTFDSMFSGTLLLGATGSGKSTMSELILKRILEHPSRPAAVWSCVKASEIQTAKKVIRKAGRMRDLVHVTVDGPWTIDLLRFLIVWLKQGTEGVSQFLARLAALASRNSNNCQDNTWQTQATQFTGKCLDLFRVVGKIPSALELFEVMISVPKDPKAAGSDAFYEKTSCGRLIELGNALYKSGKMSEADGLTFQRAASYVLQYLPGLGDRFLGSVIGTTVTGLGQLIQPPFDRMFDSGVTTLTPDLLTEEGAIIVLDLPVLTGPAAAIAQAAIFMICQMYLLQAPAENRRPVVLFRDEAQHLVIPDWDAGFQTVCRSHKVISITAVQGYSGLVSAFGGNDAARVQADMFLKMGHATHFVMNPGTDSETIKHYVELCGKSPQMMFSGSQQTNPNPSMFDQMMGVTQIPQVGWSAQMLDNLRPEHLTNLLRGGIDGNFIIQALLFQAGRRFSTGQPYAFIDVKQDITP